MPLLRQVRRIVKDNYENPKYFVFMIALLLLVILPPFTVFKNGQILMNISFGMVIVMGSIFLSSSIRELILTFLVGMMGLSIFLFFTPDDYFWFSIGTLVNFVFFTYLLSISLRFLIKEEEVDANTIFSCIAGFLLMGISSALLLFFVHNWIGNAFELPENPEFYDFIYFSFITLTSVGYGDISPTHPIAKSLTVLVGIAGQFYMTFLVAIIVGKYLSGGKSQGDDNHHPLPPE